MKILTVSLLLSTMMALTKATAIGHHDWHDQTGDPAGTFPPIVPEVPHGGWQPSCHDGWTLTRSTIHCLQYVSEEMSWTQAEDNCKSKYGTLVHINDEHIAKDVDQLMQHAGATHSQIWVGARKTSENPAWTWTKNELGFGGETDIHYWCDGQSGEPTNHCLKANFAEKKSGCLQDENCDHRLPSVCATLVY